MKNMILKNNYYCFIAGLPEVFLDDRKLALSVNGFRELAREALKKEDVKLMELFFLPADNKQVLRLLNKMAPDTNLEISISITTSGRRNHRTDEFFTCLSQSIYRGF